MAQPVSARSRVRTAILFAFVTMIMTLQAATTQAIDQGHLGTIGPTNQTIEREFLPLTGIYPGTILPVEPIAIFRPTVCRTLTYCDAFELDVDYPDRFRRLFFGVSVTLTWDNPRTQQNPTGNDLDLFLFLGDDDPVAGFPASDCQTPREDACDNLTSETIAITEPEDTTPDDVEPLRFTVVSEAGINIGYKITVKWYTFELPPQPKFERPDIQTSAETPVVTGPLDFAITEATTGSEQPSATPRKILVPGPDGELRDIELPFYAAGNRLVAASGSGLSPWISASIAGALVLAGSIWLLIVRSRHRDAEG
ncbi:MAG: hypothetical protein WD646_03920 [Actinomycetota bacterium]